VPPLRIGIDARELQGHPTGTGRYLRSLLRVWSADGEDQLVAYFNGPAPHEPVLDHPRILRRPIGARPLRGLVWQERDLPREARRDELDVFFAPAYVCPLALELPRVTALHDLSFISQPQDFSLLDGLRRRLLVGRSVRASRRLLACSEFTRREILAHFPESKGRVDYVPLGPDDDLPPPPPRNEARGRLGLGERPFLLTVGSILNRRCLPDLLRAIAELLPRHPQLVLDVAGENRTQPLLDLPRLVAHLGLARHVRLSGFVSEASLSDRYAAADALILLSDYEGFGLPALEAMARGVPVVASSRPAVGEIFGEAALLVEPRDVSGIATAVDRVLRDGVLRRDLVERGQLLASRYSWQRTAALTREALAAAARA
jgi:glycosyltransferase involved in cell wall biosynthesis